ncbi:MAG: sugar phosphate isomerase/epimerase [Defluviitaleaceae bacterium]|nr:sugar phosphate isomerase/epimerase [Defluviitaleaceae bacterium]
MRVGIDSMTLGPLKLNAIEMLDYAKKNGFEGIQFGSVRGLSPNLDAEELKRIKAHGDNNGLYTHIGISPVNPVVYNEGFDSLASRIRVEIEAAAQAGWHELHSIINIGSERYTHKIPWAAHIDGAIRLINRLRPVLEKNASRINIETHIETTFDIINVISCTGTHLTGVCLDTANTLVNAEDPVMAARRVAPYTHLTHTKDAIVCFCEEGVLRQGKPVGMGSVDFETILPVLAEYSPDLPLSIEDHKWLFKANIFEEDWIKKNPDLTPLELGLFVKLAWQTQQKLFSGEIPPVDEYGTKPFIDELEERLFFGRNYLNGLLKKMDGK